VKDFKTIHTSRTMMFAELAKVMDHSFNGDNYLESLEDNVTGKKSNSGIGKTATYLKNLYGFDMKNPSFKAFKYFWGISEPIDKPLLALVYAIHNDFLLSESIQVVQATRLNDKAAIESFEENIEKSHPNQYSPNTRKSLAQNIASSWKQAGFIEGKVKNIRKQPEITYRVACFAFFLAYIKGERGDFIWNSLGVKALCLYESKLRALAIECAKRDLMQYQYAGGVTAISFHNLLKKQE
jgi:hypothetical protein